MYTDKLGISFFPFIPEKKKNKKRLSARRFRKFCLRRIKEKKIVKSLSRKGKRIFPFDLSMFFNFFFYKSILLEKKSENER